MDVAAFFAAAVRESADALAKDLALLPLARLHERSPSGARSPLMIAADAAALLNSMARLLRGDPLPIVSAADRNLYYEGVDSLQMATQLLNSSSEALAGTILAATDEPWFSERVLSPWEEETTRFLAIHGCLMQMSFLTGQINYVLDLSGRVARLTRS